MTKRTIFFQELVHQSKKSRARVTRIHTPHGIIETPAFVPVGTNGTLKGLPSVHSEVCGTQAMFCNTYHLILQPGADVVAEAGELDFACNFCAFVKTPISVVSLINVHYVYVSKVVFTILQT